MSKFKNAEKAYEEIFKTLEKHKDICVFDIMDMEKKSKHHLFGIELREKFGLNICSKEIRGLNWAAFGQYKYIGMWGEKHNRTISWPDDGKQPEDEMLLQICFSTGAYIFGDDYPTDLFKKFWLELIGFKPKYIDTNNNALYFTMSGAEEVFNSFESILEKYYKINREDFNKRKIQKMKDDLQKLEEAETNKKNK